MRDGGSKKGGCAADARQYYCRTWGSGAACRRARLIQELADTASTISNLTALRAGTAGVAASPANPKARSLCNACQGRLHNSTMSFMSISTHWTAGGCHAREDRRMSIFAHSTLVRGLHAACPTGSSTAGAGACSRSLGQSIRRKCPFMSSTSEVQLSTQSPSLQYRMSSISRISA